MPQSTRVSVLTTAEEVQALLGLLQRVPITQAEALFIEALFERWLQAIDVQTSLNTPAPSAPLGAPSTFGAPSTDTTDRLDTAHRATASAPPVASPNGTPFTQAHPHDT